LNFITILIILPVKNCTWSILFRCGTRRSQEPSVSNLLLFLPVVCTPSCLHSGGGGTCKHSDAQVREWL